jgi:hypothetical protein
MNTGALMSDKDTAYKNENKKRYLRKNLSTDKKLKIKKSHPAEAEWLKKITGVYEIKLCYSKICCSSLSSTFIFLMKSS